MRAEELGELAVAVDGLEVRARAGGEVLFQLASRGVSMFHSFTESGEGPGLLGSGTLRTAPDETTTMRERD